MRIERVKIKNFKCYNGTFELHLNAGVNVIVGANESGKSTILEAIHLALTGLLNGRYVRNEISSHLFNLACQREYLESIGTGHPLEPPEILIELYFAGEGVAIARLEGDGNSEKKGASGIAYRIAYDKESYGESYAELINSGTLKSVPVEYYTATTSAFARRGVTPKDIPIKPALIDSSSTRFQNGSDVYVSRIIKDILEERERVAITQAHRKLREAFAEDPALKLINKRISEAAQISDKSVSVSVDLPSQNAWESGLMTYIDNIPFHYIGKGEQCIIKAKLALSTQKADEATTLLIEEPENHLSHGRLSKLIREVTAGNEKKQILIATHSSFVANKLGLENLILLRHPKVTRIPELKSADFFRKLAGYDTLRLVLAKKAILVEGDSDELIVQRAYMDANGGRLPIEDDVDVISVGTSFLRFLELAAKLDVPVSVVTDNDGDPSAVRRKYEAFLNTKNVKICFDETIDDGNLLIAGKKFNYNTLEPKILKVNDVDVIKGILGVKCRTVDELHVHMKSNKTDCALAIFNAKEKIVFPDYINQAIAL